MMHRAHHPAGRGRCLVLTAVAGLALAACRPAPAFTPEPIGSQVAARLTRTGVVPTLTRPAATATASRTAAPTASRTPTVSPAPSETPTPTETDTPAPTARPTVELGSLPYPPAAFGGASHFYFGSPTGGFIASSYRYGSVGPGQRFATHHGVDYSAPAGANLVAVAAGTIYYAGNDLERLFGPQADFYGNLVVLQLAQPWNGRAVYALYGQMDQVAVQTGQAVNAGDVLGTVGATGVALGPHPHLEVRLDFPESYWDTRNPELWLTPSPGTGTLAVRVTNAAGFFLPGVRVEFVCADAAPRFMETYWYSGVNPDDVYFENAAMMNLPPGYCDFELTLGGETYEYKDGLVQAGTVSFVHIQIDP
jgi:murein DD-endopeptidase MepM/ murein hydrolase activator NlpD